MLIQPTLDTLNRLKLHGMFAVNYFDRPATSILAGTVGMSFVSLR
jgi:hypothetical protein